jgi:ATP-dependent protease ClpP protease subunit
LPPAGAIAVLAGRRRGLILRLVEVKTQILHLRKQIEAKTCLEYFGCVNYATNERVIRGIQDKMEEFPSKSIYLTVTSPGGPTGTAMSFYDQLKYVLRPNLTTIGSGDVDSSGIIIFLTGDTRYVTKHTTLFFHLAGRIFEEGRRFTAKDLDAMAREDKIKDHQYASLVAERSGGKLEVERVLNMMEKNTICLPDELVSYGLAHAVLE